MALKNAVSGWFQGEVVARNITRLVGHSNETYTTTLPANHGQPPTTTAVDPDELESFVPGQPVIKITVGKNTYVFQRPNSETLEPEVGEYEAKEDLDAVATWSMYGADTGDLFA